jgi:hypothetical protein
MHFLGEYIDKVLCDRHGWQPIAKEKTKPKRKNSSGEQRIPF